MNKYLLWILLLVGVSCTPLDKDFTDGKVEFVAAQKVPIVEGTINGKKALFIIDTGASMSVLDYSQEDHYDFQSYESMDAAVGYGGVASFRDASHVQGDIGGVPLNIHFKTQDLSVIVGVIQRFSSIKVAGVVGSDWLKRNKIVIDYSNSELRRDIKE